MIALINEDAPGNHSLLGKVFDSYQNLMQIASCVRLASKQLDVDSPSLLELSRRETGLKEYLPEVSIQRYPTHDNEQPALPDPLVLPYADHSFDVCVITDVYEHIPRDLRPRLLKEMMRVTNGLVLLGTPKADEVVSRFDRIVFDFIWGKHRESFEPLKQHVEFGLEPLEAILKTIREQGADRAVALPCNYVYRWVHLILIFFDFQYKAPYPEFFEPFNRIYNERLSPYDYKEPCYRYLVAIATNSKIHIESFLATLKAKTEEPTDRAKETEGVLLETFRSMESSMSDQLLLSKKEEARLNKIIGDLQTDNQWALNEIQHLKANTEEPTDRAKETEGILLETFRSMESRMSDQLLLSKKEEARLNKIVSDLQTDNQWALNEIQHLKELLRISNRSLPRKILDRLKSAL